MLSTNSHLTVDSLPVFVFSIFAYFIKCLFSLVTLVNRHLIVDIPGKKTQLSVVSWNIVYPASFLLNMLSWFGIRYCLLGSHVQCICLLLAYRMTLPLCHCNIPKVGKIFPLHLKNYCLWLNRKHWLCLQDAVTTTQCPEVSDHL